jgi:hypothetical protein
MLDFLLLQFSFAEFPPDGIYSAFGLTLRAFAGARVQSLARLVEPYGFSSLLMGNG